MPRKLVKGLQSRAGKLAEKIPESVRRRGAALAGGSPSPTAPEVPPEPFEPAESLDGSTAILPQVDEVDEEPRRTSSRIRVPHSFCFVDENGRPIALELTLIIDGPVPSLGECYLFDINEGGVGFITTEILNKGEQITICVTRPDDPEPLVAVEVEVLNQRDFAGDKSHLPERFLHQPSWIYGVRMDEDSLGTLMCATLESLELEGQGMETDKRPGSADPASLRNKRG